MKDKLRILLRIALVLLLVCGVTVGVLYANRDIGIPIHTAFSLPAGSSPWAAACLRFRILSRPLR